MSSAATPSLPFDCPAENSERVYLNPQVWLEQEDGLCVVWVHYAPWHRFVLSSELDRRIVGANLVMAGLAKTVEVVEALGMSRATLHRDRQRLAEGGLPALAQMRKGPKAPTKATPQLRARARRYYGQGESKNAIAKKLGVSEGTIRGILKDVPSPTAGPEQAPLLEEAGAGNASGEPCQAVGGAEAAGATMQGPSAVGFEPQEVHPPGTSERDLDRSAERVWARFGLITEASVRFVCGQELRFVGALLIVPALAAQGFFAGVEASYGKLKNGFYGLRHTVMTLCLMMALRITRAEHLSGVAPAALGRLLGLDRAPEVKTLRRRVHEIAKLGQASALMRWLAARLAENDAEALDFVYIDGHVRAYFGKRRISKTYVTQRRLAMPAVSDFWVNDARGEPLLVVTGEVSAGLTGQLLPILEEVRTLLAEGQRATVVFDRGGWSPQLFRQILEAGFDVLTYRKGKAPRYPAKDFVEHRLEVQGRTVSYRLRDGLVRPGAKLQLRCVVRWREDGKQTHIVTSRRDLPAAEVAYRMFERWRQENYFKYAGEELDLNALDTYEIEPADPERMVPNAQRTKLDKTIALWRKKAKALEAQLGRAIDTNEEAQPAISTEDFKLAHSALRAELATVREKLAKLIVQRKRLPKRITVREALGEDEQALALTVEHKHFMNILKMAVYRAESALYRLLEPHYRRNDQEGRALLREAFRASGSLALHEGYLKVTLEPLSAPRRSRAIAALCRDLNATATRIPGTSLKLQFDVQSQECLKCA
jgi:Transposase protein/CENP-B N-terminal DNA-binding domain